MKNNLFGRTLVIGIIILFVGASFISNISGNIVKINNLQPVKETVLKIKDQDLVGWWGFDEGSGTIIHDSSGNGNDGTRSGATWTTNTSNGIGFALSFDGLNDFVNIPGSSDFEFANQDLTYSVWVQIFDNVDHYRAFISLADASDLYGIPKINLVKYRSGGADGRIYFQLCNVK